jgi:single-strand DNA-binding protein
MLNKVIMMGRLCDDPDFRQTQSQIPVCRFRIAVNRPKAKDGQEKTDFINCVAWRSSAEFVSRYFFKGSMIVIEGRMQNNDYTDGNGTKHYSYEVLCDNVTFGESKKAQEGAAAPQQQQGYQGGYQNQQYGAAPQQYQQTPPPPPQYQGQYQQAPPPPQYQDQQYQRGVY